MCQDRNLYSHASVIEGFVPEVKPLTAQTAEAFVQLATALRAHSSGVNLRALDQAEQNLDQRLQSLRDTRATSPFSLDRMLPFWSFSFNLKEIVGSLRELNEKLGNLI